MADEERGGVRQWVQRILSVLGALPVLYVLSIGPVIRLLAQSNVGFGSILGWFLLLYGPLFWVGDRCPPFGDALSWYIGLWI